MEAKNLIGLTLMVMGIVGVTVVTSITRRGRELVFVLVIVLTVLTYSVDINFVSYERYRGTTRGLEASLVDIMVVGTLIGLLLVPREGTARWYWPAGLGFLLSYLVYNILIVAFQTPQIFGIFELSKIVRGLLVFLLAVLFVRDRRAVVVLVFGLACALSLESLIAIKQRYIDEIHRVGGHCAMPTVCRSIFA